MLRIALAPVGAGKTEAALRALTATVSQADAGHRRFPRVWVLLATRRQEDAFRQRLIELDDGHRLYFNVEFFDFYSLYRRLLNVARQPARGLNDAARYGVLRTVIARLKADQRLPLYGVICETPGFVRIVAALIFELKQNRVEPETFVKAAQTRRDHELAAIYAGYQRILQDEDLVDKEGEGWLALSRLDDLTADQLKLDLLVVDGYDQFTEVQVRLLQKLARLTGQTLVTLTTVPGREDTIGRRFQRALETLTQDEHGQPYPVEIERLTGAYERHPDLQHLGESVFQLRPYQRRASGGIELIEAPNAAAEVGAILRRVKWLLINGWQPDDMLIALRDWTYYQPHFVALAQEYRLPLALHYGEALTENPLIAALLNLFDLHRRNYRRREVLDALRSPYFQVDGITPAEVALLDQISQQFTVTEGRDLWTEAFSRATERIIDDDGEIHEPLLPVHREAPLSASLESFFEAVTPPEAGTMTAYVDWLESLLGTDPVETRDDDAPDLLSQPYSLRVIDQVRGLNDRNGGDETTRARDLMALDSLKRVLRGLLTAHELLARLSHNPADGQLITRETFMLELRTALESARSDPHPTRGGRVLVTTAANARGLPHQHVFIPGLSEGIFPAPIPEDPLYLDSERRDLTAHGVRLPLAAERATDDGLFYELISLPRRSLTLSRPTAQEGQPWSESHLWRAVRQVYADLPVSRYRAGEVVPAAEAASVSEVALAVADALNTGQIKQDPELAGLYNWLIYHQTPYWTQIRSAREVERRRLSREPHDHYSGRLHDPALIAQAAQATGQDRLWSASQLNEFGACGFQFFAKRLLRLEALKPPETGMDVLQSGSLVHAILDRTYNILLEGELSIVPEHTDAALEVLQEVAQQQLAAAPERYGFRPTALWAQEQQTLTARLERLVRLDFSPESPIAKAFPGAERKPYRLEVPFGREHGVPVEVDLGEAGKLRLNGYIDRIDRVDDRLVVIDYKSGSTRFSTNDMRDGRSFQMVVYLLAVRQIAAADPSPYAPREIAGGVFWHLADGKISGTLRDAADGEIIEAAVDHLGRYVQFARRGDFTVQPGKIVDGQCSRYCEYRQLCRLCGLNLAKD